MFVLPSLVVLDIVLEKGKKNRAQRQQLKTGHLGCERFVIFSTQVPGMLKNTPKHEEGLYQPTINLTWNQLRINLDFCVQSFGLWSLNYSDIVYITKWKHLCLKFILEGYRISYREIGIFRKKVKLLLKALEDIFDLPSAAEGTVGALTCYYFIASIDLSVCAFYVTSVGHDLQSHSVIHLVSRVDCARLANRFFVSFFLSLGSIMHPSSESD
jgi:hypothetical protein